MKKIIYLLTSFILFGCSSSYNYRSVPPRFCGKFVNSEQMMQSRYYVSHEFVTRIDSAYPNIFLAKYNGKDISDLKNINLEKNKLQIIPAPLDTVTIYKVAYENHKYINNLGMKVYIINTSADTFSPKYIFDEGRFLMIQEAKNQIGLWKPIEFWIWGCIPDSYSGLNIPPNTYAAVNSFRYRGDFRTELRYKMYWRDENQKGHILYSHPYDGSINLSQFDIPEPYDSPVEGAVFFDK